LRHLSRSLGGTTFILLAATLWGTTGTARTFAPAGAGPLTVGAIRIVGGGLLLFLIALRGGALRDLVATGTSARCLVALAAAAVAVYQAAFFAATARTGVAIGTVVTIGAAPAFAGVLSLLTRPRTRPTGRWLAATVAAVAGCALLVTSGHASGGNLAGIALALLASFCYAVYAVIASHLIGNGAQDRAVIGAIFGGAAVLLLPVLVTGHVGWLATGRGLAVAGYLAVLTTAVGYLLYARGLRTTPVTTATTLGLAEPAIAAVLGLTVLGEHLSAAGFAGLAVLAAGLMILAWPTGGSKDRDTSRSADLPPAPASRTADRRAAPVCGNPAAMPYSDGREPSQVPAPARRDPAQAAWRPSARPAGRRRGGGRRNPGAEARAGTDRVRTRR
jgi:DME family drug/metabolite transporter